MRVTFNFGSFLSARSVCGDTMLETGSEIQKCVGSDG